MRGLFFWTLDVGRKTVVVVVGFISVSRWTAFDSAPRYKKDLTICEVFFFVPRLKSGVIKYIWFVPQITVLGCKRYGVC